MSGHSSTLEFLLTNSLKSWPWPYWVVRAFNRPAPVRMDTNNLFEKPHHKSIGAFRHMKSWLEWMKLQNVLYLTLAIDKNAHLHPQSQGLQIYSLHHQCQGSSWSQKVRRMRCMELRHRGSSYRMAWGSQLLVLECASWKPYYLAHAFAMPTFLPAQKHTKSCACNMLLSLKLCDVCA